MNAALPRLFVAVVLAAIVTFLVFWVMQSLITSGSSSELPEDHGRLVGFVDLSKDDDVNTKERQLKKPPTPAQEPQKPELLKPELSDTEISTMDIGAVDMSADLTIDSGLSGAAMGDGEYLPIVKVAPQYPRRAVQRGLEGYVIVEFTVDKTGAVINPIVIEAKPANVFNRAAISAAKKFKYKPKIVDGEPIVVEGVKNIIRFQLDKSSNK